MAADQPASVAAGTDPTPITGLSPNRFADQSRDAPALSPAAIHVHTRPYTGTWRQVAVGAAAGGDKGSTVATGAEIMPAVTPSATPDQHVGPRPTVGPRCSRSGAIRAAPGSGHSFRTLTTVPIPAHTRWAVHLPLPAHTRVWAGVQRVWNHRTVDSLKHCQPSDQGQCSRSCQIKDPNPVGVSARVWFCCSGQMVSMPTRAGRQKRPKGSVETIKTSLNISQASWDIAENAAQALGISRDAYLEALLAREKFDQRGRPKWWSKRTAPSWWIDPDEQQELPLKSA